MSTPAPSETQRTSHQRHRTSMTPERIPCRHDVGRQRWRSYGSRGFWNLLNAETIPNSIIREQSVHKSTTQEFGGVGNITATLTRIGRNVTREHHNKAASGYTECQNHQINRKPWCLRCSYISCSYFQKVGSRPIQQRQRKDTIQVSR